MAIAAMVTAPIGLGLGRIANFINGELYGRVTEIPWAMVFPDGGDLPRHPSQLYESLFEGWILFAILWFASRRPGPDGRLSLLFVFFYGLFRFGIEFVREPDPQIGLVFGPFTLGQLLCLAMIVTSLLLWPRLRNLGNNLGAPGHTVKKPTVPSVGEDTRSSSTKGETP